MTTATNLPSGVPWRATVLPTEWSLADLQTHLGNVPLERIRSYPPPGLATEDDALEVRDRGGPACELIDGVLVEKAVGTYESLLAGVLMHLLHAFLEHHPLGVIIGPDGPLRLKAGNVRLPDVSFIRWERFPNRKLPRTRVWAVAPDLAVEILSEGNTPQEIERKVAELFESGTRYVWVVEPASRQAKVFSSATEVTAVDERGALAAPEVLPDFQLRLGDLLDRVPLEANEGEPQ